MYFKFSIFILLSLQYSLAEREDYRHWKRLADDDIFKALENRPNTNVAKNIILFIGDGMDMSTVTASRIYSNGENGSLVFENFQNIGTIKTYAADKLVPDSANTATALYSGVKTNYKTLGVRNVTVDDCPGVHYPPNRLKTILNWAQEAGKSTGFVTTTRVTHATPAALYAKAANRNWECEAKIPAGSRQCKDIARQLIEDEPGKNINVIFGGGLQSLISDVKGSVEDPTDTWACYSKDGRNLVHDWEKDKQNRGVSHSFVGNRMDLLNLDVENNDYVLGIFANSHMYMRNDNGTLNVVHPRQVSNVSQPTIQEMTDTAIRLLQRNENGFLLMVEGGLIDYAHHRGHARSALEETAEFNKAIKSALGLTKEEADETLVIVTADHAHSLVMTGYPNREDGVLGIAQNSKWDKIPITTLLYATGGPNNYQYEIVNGSVFRRDPTRDNITSYDYSQQTGIVSDETIHSGADVLVYARGPMAHLFNSVHEQTYVAYVIAYAAKFGPYGENELYNTYSINASYINNYRLATIVAALFSVLATTVLLSQLV